MTNRIPRARNRTPDRASSSILMAEDIDYQRSFSDRTFGPGPRTGGVLAHIRKELAEIEADPDDLEEWADALILVIDGATRRGYSGGELLAAYHEKIKKNVQRRWPDWRNFSQDEPIEHVREEAS